ncbi:MAG TPA: DUF4982 domain-containing protein, partial [Prolixibacteraceae bacterium]|nr:DUF4982 domain-containing protein [Prolixibacteraceae bacterium]
WTGIDYLGESGAWPSRGFYSGFLDFGGFLKPRGHFREALWSIKPVTYIGTYPKQGDRNHLSTDAWPIWNYDKDQLIRVVCYTNAEKSKLFLNGTQVGEVKPLDDNTGVIYWDIPFQNGKLEVLGYDKNDQQICSYSIQSSSRPTEIKATPDLTVIKKDRGVAQVVVQIVDEKGIPVMISEDEVTCELEGPGKLLGLEASNNSDMGNYSDAVQRVYHGRMIAYIQSAGTTGTINLKFSAPWLKDAAVTLQVIE